MKIYNIYHDSNKYLAIKVGWSWSASLIGGYWAIFHKIWLPAIVYFIIVLPLIYSDMIFYEISLFVSVSYFFIFGSYGNKWLEKQAISKGFKLLDTITAESPESAISHYLKEISGIP